MSSLNNLLNSSTFFVGCSISSMCRDISASIFSSIVPLILPKASCIFDNPNLSSNASVNSPTRLFLVYSQFESVCSFMHPSNSSCSGTVFHKSSSSSRFSNHSNSSVGVKAFSSILPLNKNS